MNKSFLLSLSMMISTAAAFGQAGAPASYYNGFNFNQTGAALKSALATKITSTHTKTLNYQQAENAIKVVDLEPGSNTNVLLIYGFSNNICPSSASDDNDHRLRNKNNDGGGASCEWNREHTYAQSLGTPDLNQTGPGADPHHLRASDVQRNGARGSRKFAEGSGNSGAVGANWYPGDEWKGDVARMMMYMYLRYGSRCLPTNVGTGATVASDPSMLQLFLKWNAEDPVSPYEDNRNTYLGSASNTYGQGNRNPFIDNPYLATIIWGGMVAENRWPALEVPLHNMFEQLTVYPVPANEQRIHIDTDLVLDEIQLININGQLVMEIKKLQPAGRTYTIGNIPAGFYFLRISSAGQVETRKVIVN